MTQITIPPKIKICGICNLQDAQLAIKYNAQYIGLIFVKSSPRYIEPNIAKSIVASINNSISNKIQIVGVFQNSDLEEMENIASLVGLDYFQLHGHESPSLCNSLSKPVIKAFQIARGTVAEDACLTLPFDHWLNTLEQYRSYCQHFLFDKPKKTVNPNWLDFAIKELLIRERYLGNYFLAGGLNASNVQTILQELKPSVLDIASGIENTARTKSETLLAQFCTQTKILNNPLSVSENELSRLEATN